MVEVIRHDIVIVGGGAAGIRAAIAAVEASPEASVAMWHTTSVWQIRVPLISIGTSHSSVAKSQSISACGQLSVTLVI